MKKIGFVCLAGLDQFIDPIIEGLSNDYIIRKFIIRAQQEIYSAIDWADIVWLEWCNQSAIIGTNYEGIKGKKVIIRLHSYEVFMDFTKRINWTVVDKLIFVAPHIRGILEEFIPGINEKVKTEIVYNGIDLDKTLFKEREPGYDIAWVGFINYKKNPQMALQILKKLTDIDKGYKLHVAGSYQDSRYKIYLDYMIKEMGLQDNIKFHGWIDDMEKFWEDKNYLLHTSIQEGHSYAIMEAMTRGIKPVIHNFRGSRELYQNSCIFNTTEEAANKIMHGFYESKKYYSWIKDNHWTLNEQIKNIKNIIEGI